MEAIVVAKNDDNNSIESDEKLLTVKVIDETNDKPVLNVINVGDMNEDETLEANSSSHQLEHSIKESTLSDKELQRDTESKLNTNDALNAEATASLDDSDTRNGHVDTAAVDERGAVPDNIETTLDETQNKTIQETNVESSLESGTDKSPVLKPEDNNTDKDETGALECGLEDKTVQLTDGNHHKSHQIVRDSSGAELFETGRDSTAFEHDKLILQNDNFRISQLSFN